MKKSLSTLQSNLDQQQLLNKLVQNTIKGGGAITCPPPLGAITCPPPLGAQM